MRILREQWFARRWITLVHATIATLALGYLFLVVAPEDKQEAVQAWRGRLETAAEDRTRGVDRLFSGYAAEARTLASYPTVQYLLSGRRGPPYPFPTEQGPQAHLRHLLDDARETHHYLAAVVYDARGREVAQSGPAQLALQGAANRSIESDAVSVDVQAGQRDTLVLARAPVVVSGKFLGTVVVVLRGRDGLFPILTASLPRQTFESLLVRRVGDSIEFMSPRAKRALRAVDQKHLAAHIAAEGVDTFDVFLDYAGDRIFAATRKLTSARWGIVAKIDEAEALADYRKRMRNVASMVLALVIGLTGLAYSLTSDLRARRRLESEHREKAELRAVAASEEARQGYELLSAITESTSDAIYAKDLEGRYVFVNRSGATQLGYTPGQMIGRTDFELAPRGTAALFREWDLQTISTGESITEERQGELHGAIHTWSVTQAPLKDHEGNITGVVGIARDISELLSTREQIGIMHARVEKLLGSQLLGIAFSKKTGEVVAANDYYLDLLHASRADLEAGHVSWKTRTPAEYVHVDDKSLQELAESGKSTPYEKEYEREDGSRVRVIVGDAVMPGCEDEIISFVLDITSHKQLELEFQHAQKMEAIGRLAGGVAHDFNNILTAIKGLAAMAADDLSYNDPLKEDLDEIGRAAERATTLTRQLLAFSRRQVLQPRVLDVAELVSGMERMLQRLIGEDVVLRIDVKESPLFTKADAGQIEQIVLNLAVNARDAMPTGGDIRISVHNGPAEISARTIHSENASASDKFVCISVEDNGEGMDQETLSKIFEPFFTTKEIGKGTGLGLATVYGIVKQSGGFMNVTSLRHVGTRFDIYFPRCTALNESRPESKARPEVCARRLNILLVEDEDGVRRLATRALRRAGHVVTEAENGGEALLAAERADRRFDVVITDMVMPGMSGPDLIARLRKVQKDLRVLYVSGYSADMFSGKQAHRLDGAYLEKPFSPASLLKAVERVALDATPQIETTPLV